MTRSMLQVMLELAALVQVPETDGRRYGCDIFLFRVTPG
jgi:hypothetical protein